MRNVFQKIMISGIIVVISSILNIAAAQVDTLAVARPDTTVQQKTKETQQKKSKKRKDEFILYAGVNLNQFYIGSSQYESPAALGYHLGGAYKRGKFFYWQVGARYNNPVYSLKDVTTGQEESDFLILREIDIPITGGINFLSFVNRIVALRVFVSLDPSFILGIRKNDFAFTKDDLNTFIFNGQAGAGINVAFLVIEAGYNYGFQDQFKDFGSKTGQIFVNLGFRF